MRWDAGSWGAPGLFGVVTIYASPETSATLLWTLIPLCIPVRSFIYILQIPLNPIHFATVEIPQQLIFLLVQAVLTLPVTLD